MSKTGKKQEMSDCTTRRLLKKKVIDRWENEGGRISAGPTSEDECGQATARESEGNQLSGSSDTSADHTLSSPEKKRLTLKK
jgi:hypothetical protein